MSRKSTREGIGANLGRDGLRWQAVAIALILVVQYVVGVGVNLYVSVPAADHDANTFSAIGKAISNGPGALAAHTILALVLIVLALLIAVGAIRARRRAPAALALLGLLSLLAAASAGAEFVGHGGNAASMVMAALTGVALACYLLICCLAG